MSTSSKHLAPGLRARTGTALLALSLMLQPCHADVTQLAKDLTTYGKFCAKPSAKNVKPCATRRQSLWKQLTPQAIAEVGQTLQTQQDTRRQKAVNDAYDPHEFLALSGIFAAIINTMQLWSKKFPTLQTSFDPNAEKENGLPTLKKTLGLLAAFVEIAPVQLRGTAAIWGINLAAYLETLALNNHWIKESTEKTSESQAHAFFEALKKEFHADNLHHAKQSINNDHATRALSVYSHVFLKTNSPFIEKLKNDQELLTTLVDKEKSNKPSDEKLKKIIQENIVKAHPDHTTFFWHYCVAEEAQTLLDHPYED